MALTTITETVTYRGKATGKTVTIKITLVHGTKTEKAYCDGWDVPIEKPVCEIEQSCHVEGHGKVGGHYHKPSSLVGYPAGGARRGHGEFHRENTGQPGH